MPATPIWLLDNVINGWKKRLDAFLFCRLMGIVNGVPLGLGLKGGSKAMFQANGWGRQGGRCGGTQGGCWRQGGEGSASDSARLKPTDGSAGQGMQGGAGLLKRGQRRPPCSC